MSGWLLMVDALMQEGERNSGRSSLLAHFVHHQLKGSRASGPTAVLKPVLFCCTCSSSPPLPLPCHLPVIPAPRPCFSLVICLSPRPCFIPRRALASSCKPTQPLKLCRLPHTSFCCSGGLTRARLQVRERIVVYFFAGPESMTDVSRPSHS